MEEEAAMSLPDDLVLEILKRVQDVAIIFRCGMACKRWRRLVADPSFLRRCLPEEACNSALFLGFIAPIQPHETLYLVPGPWPVFGPRRRSLISFIPKLHIFDHAVPLISRHGRLLVRLHAHSAHGRLAVCNVVTGTLDILPNLEHYFSVERTSYALLTDADCLGSNNNDNQHQTVPFFQVQIIDITRQYLLCTFSSAGDPRWNIRTGNTEGGARHAPLWQHSAVVHRGMVRWLFQGRSGIYTFDVNANTSQISFIKIPTDHEFRLSRFDEPCIGIDTDGRITVMDVNSSSSELEMGTLHYNGWLVRTQMLVLLNDVVYTSFGERSNSLLISDKLGPAYVADIKTNLVLLPKPI